MKHGKHDMCMRNVVKHGIDYAKGMIVGTTGYIISGVPVVVQNTYVPASISWIGELMKIIVALCTAVYLVVKTISIIKNGKE